VPPSLHRDTPQPPPLEPPPEPPPSPVALASTPAPFPTSLCLPPPPPSCQLDVPPEPPPPRPEQPRATLRRLRVPQRLHRQKNGRREFRQRRACSAAAREFRRRHTCSAAAREPNADIPQPSNVPDPPPSNSSTLQVLGTRKDKVTHKSKVVRKLRKRNALDTLKSSAAVSTPQVPANRKNAIPNTRKKQRRQRQRRKISAPPPPPSTPPSPPLVCRLSHPRRHRSVHAVAPTPSAASAPAKPPTCDSVPATGTKSTSTARATKPKPIPESEMRAQTTLESRPLTSFVSQTD
ncbi:hypothetical protein BC826DRAFT_1112147, partial [Russula brevipes]